MFLNQVLQTLFVKPQAELVKAFQANPRIQFKVERLLRLRDYKIFTFKIT
jgi:hypothetical protein